MKKLLEVKIFVFSLDNVSFSQGSLLEYNKLIKVFSSKYYSYTKTL